MDNGKIADVFDELAELLEFKGENPFRVRAYHNGARAIRDLDEPVADILADPSRELSDVPGIGKTLVDKCRTLIATGSLPQLDSLRQEIPATVLAMVRIPGIGAKKAATLHSELGIDTLDALRKSCESGQVRKLKGFGAKTEQAILDGLQIAETAGDRILWAAADALVQRLRNFLQQCPAVEQLEFAGSYRRGRETVGDLDILCVASDRDVVMDHFQSLPERTDTILRGDAKKTKMSIHIVGGLQVDLRMVDADQFGAALQYFTGSKAHNVHLRSLARRRGLKLNEYGVFEEGSSKRIAGRTEAEVYAALGLPLFPPELRENRSEFEWAEDKRGLPKLITLEAIRGDLHMHTSATDGTATLREMADAAIARGLQYIAITDHSRRVTMARGLDANRLLEQWKDIEQLRKEYAGRLIILKGIECDVLEAGGMDLPDDVLAQADWVLASIHYGQKQSRERITERIMGAIRNPHVSCIAHPTGRLINRRGAYEADMEAIFTAAAETGTMMELNANPARLDLHDVHCAAARRHGIPVVISTDAHAPEGLDVMRYGVLQARRGGLTAADVANARPWNKMRALIGRC